jgi:mRNA interferase YafQ
MVKPYIPQLSPLFLEDMKRLEELGYDISELKKVMKMLSEKQTLPGKYDDHPLQGPWEGYNGPHISNDPDVILIYRYDGQKVRFERTGSHRELYTRGQNKRKK